MTKVDLSIDLAGIKMKNPVTTASGTFGFGQEYFDYYDVNKLGAVIVKSITKEERIGNAPPRIIETPAGLLNSIGLKNPGIESFLRDTVPELNNINIPIIVSIAGDTVEEYVYLAERLSDIPEAAGIELNISCPNVEYGGLAFGTDPAGVRELTAAVKSACEVPLIVKLSPNVTDIVEVAEAAVEGGADVLALVNTLLGMQIDVSTKKPVLANNVGGLSGPAIKPVALRMVWQVAQEVNVPIVGIGGICSHRDALEFIMAGASSVAVGTWNFVNPHAPVEIINGLERYCEKRGIDDIKDLIGSALDS